MHHSLFMFLFVIENQFMVGVIGRVAYMGFVFWQAHQHQKPILSVSSRLNGFEYGRTRLFGMLVGHQAFIAAICIAHNRMRFLAWSAITAVVLLVLIFLAKTDSNTPQVVDKLGVNKSPITL